KDANGDTLWVWCYPCIDAGLRDVILRKCCLTFDKQVLHTFVFGQFCRTWYYITTMEVQEPSALQKVTHFSVVVTAKDFNPEKYAAFCRVLGRVYMKHGSPVKIMEGYIAVLTKGICQSDENGSFLLKDYDIRKAYLASSLKVWHRKDWSILHPFVHLHDEELETLKQCTGYVAGFVQAEVRDRSELFDVFVNLPDSEITVSQSAREAMTLGKLHKEIGNFIVQAAEDADHTDAQVIKDLSGKTKEILGNLMSLASESDNWKLTLETLKQRRYPPATENFLFHLAAAEQLLKI
ncbi:hypothetical protein DNTS_035385, partial [Danionella cerebrum]